MKDKPSRRQWLSGLARGWLTLLLGARAAQAATAPAPAHPAKPEPPRLAQHIDHGCTTLTYDAGGRVTSTTDPAGPVTTVCYDRQGRPHQPGQHG